MITEEIKTKIDNMSYKSMLSLWRFAPSGDPMFKGEVGKYFGDVMAEKRKTADHVSTSKYIGWE